MAEGSQTKKIIMLFTKASEALYITAGDKWHSKNVWFGNKDNTWRDL